MATLSYKVPPITKVTYPVCEEKLDWSQKVTPRLCLGRLQRLFLQAKRETIS